MRPLVLIGAGGHGRVVLELVRALGTHTVIGFIDPEPVAPTILGVPVLGADEVLPGLRAQGVADAFVALGGNRLRQKVGETVRTLGFTQPALVHPSALLSPTARLASGALVMARAVLGVEAWLGHFAILNTGAIADHDNLLEDACHVAPGCALAGTVRVGARSLIGVGSAIRPGITIGADAIVGAGSAVVADVPDGGRVGGAPARALKNAPSST
jgi:UDP-perosamine 4-acetyltransferase